MKRPSCADLGVLYRFRLEDKVNSPDDVIFYVVEWIVHKVSEYNVTCICLRNIGIADVVVTIISVEQKTSLVEVGHNTNALFDAHSSLAAL